MVAFLKVMFTLVFWALIAYGCAALLKEDPEKVAERAAAAERHAERERIEAEEAKAKEATCPRDIECIVPKIRTDAFAKCMVRVQSVAKIDYKWTNGFLEPSFNRWFWRSREDGVVTFSGNEIAFQNGFGAWIRHSYECDYDVDHKGVVDIRVSAGRS